MTATNPSPRYRSYSKEDVQLQIRLKPELRERLAREAGRRTVSINLLAERALEQSLDAWEQQNLP